MHEMTIPFNAPLHSQMCNRIRSSWTRFEMVASPDLTECKGLLLAQGISLGPFSRLLIVASPVLLVLICDLSLDSVIWIRLCDGISVYRAS